MLFLKSCIFNLLLLLSFVWAAPTISKRNQNESVLPRDVTSIETLNVKREVELSNYLQRRGDQQSLSIRSGTDMEDTPLFKRAGLERRSPKSIFTKIKDGFKKAGQWIGKHKDAIIQGVGTAVKIGSKFIRRMFGGSSVQPNTK